MPSSIEVMQGKTMTESPEILPLEVIEHCIQSNLVVLINDVSMDIRYRHHPYMKKEGVRSVLSMPLNHKGAVYITFVFGK